MLSAIKYNLAHLADFNGRQARYPFWMYVLFLVIVHVIVSLLLTVPMAAGVAGDVVTAARDGAGEAEVQAQIFGRMEQSLRMSMWVSAALSLVSILLLTAAFARRLHDSNKPTWIALLAAAVQIVALVLTISTLDEVVAMMQLAQSGDLAQVQAMQQKLMLQGLLGYIPLILLVVFGAWPSTPGDNRYGPQPVAGGLEH